MYLQIFFYQNKGNFTLPFRSFVWSDFFLFFNKNINGDEIIYQLL